MIKVINMQEQSRRTFVKSVLCLAAGGACPYFLPLTTACEHKQKSVVKPDKLAKESETPPRREPVVKAKRPIGFEPAYLKLHKMPF